MTREKEYRTRVPKTLNFEMNIYEEFQDLCKKQEVSVSRRLQEFMIEAIEKNALGVKPNAIGVSYITNYLLQAKKPSESENITLDQWIKNVKQMNSLPQLGKIKGDLTKKAQIVQVRMNQIKETVL